ncbi:MAG: PCRF domain-containing protein, partial [Corynebacterium variabile]|nr:PCRF domain-containing protein [Corynebacterium variabile]
MAGSPSKVDDILSEYQGLEMQLSDPVLHNDAAAARRVAKRFSELQPVIQTYNRLTQAREDHEAAAEMASEDAEFAAEADRLAAEIPALEEKLTDLLAPR